MNHRPRLLPLSHEDGVCLRILDALLMLFPHTLLLRMKPGVSQLYFCVCCPSVELSYHSDRLDGPCVELLVFGVNSPLILSGRFGCPTLRRCRGLHRSWLSCLTLVLLPGHSHVAPGVGEPLTFRFQDCLRHDALMQRFRHENSRRQSPPGTSHTTVKHLKADRQKSNYSPLDSESLA